MKAFLDTHAAVALYEGRVELFGARAADLLARSALFVSPVVRLELAFLGEIGRLRVDPDEVLDTLSRECGVAQSEDPVSAVVARAMAVTWTRDPFDRLLVATAELHRTPFVTRDQAILDNFDGAVW